MGVKVAKFGGSSVADGIQMAKIKEIVQKDSSIHYVVVSAPGKRFEADSKITDLLYSCKTHMEHNLPVEQLFQAVKDRFHGIALSLGLNLSLEQELNDILEEMGKGASSDYVASRGEYLNAKLIASFLGYDFVDAGEMILFDESGRFLEEETNQSVMKKLKKHKKAVIPGFYGKTSSGHIKTFSRGGSDITGAIVARAVKAEVYENWTDVSGLLMADPRIIKKPRPISRISYKELRELSYMGASVLHEDAVYPVRKANIPINIRNTNEPDNPGTVITDQPAKKDGQQVITGIAGSKDFTVVGIHKHQLPAERGFVRRMAGILEDYDIGVEHLPSGIDTISVVMSNKEVNGRIDQLVDEFQRQLQPDNMEVFDDVALIATVGMGMSFRPGVSAQLFSALADAGVNIRMIDQGSSEMNIIVGVNNKDFETSVKAIYQAFITE